MNRAPLCCALSCVAALPLIACSPQAQPQAEASAKAMQAAMQPGTHPVSGLEVIPLTVRSDDRVHRFRVEVAASPEAQNRGLMFRTEMGPDEGMSFPSDPPEARSFWMKNTPLPLDIIFIGTDGRILNIAVQEWGFFGFNVLDQTSLEESDSSSDNKKEINDVFKGKKYRDILNFSSENIKRMTMK